MPAAGSPPQVKDQQEEDLFRQLASLCEGDDLQQVGISGSQGRDCAYTAERPRVDSGAVVINGR